MASLLAAGGASATAAPRKIFAIAQQQPAGVAEVMGNPSDSIMLYDVTSIGSPGATNVFGNSPLFTVWLGYEIFEGQVGDDQGNGVPRGNREDTSAITFNPANGTMYAVAFDSGSAGTQAAPNNPDPVGDNQGDNDLYRIDYQELLKDFVTNNRPKGTIYAPPTQRIPTANETALQGFGSPLFDGTVDGIAHNVPHPASVQGLAPPTIFIDNAISKVGEVGRSPNGITFFDTEISFVNPATLVLLDTATRPEPGAPEGDFQIRALERVSAAPGAAVIDFDGPDNAVGPPGDPAADDDQQGGRNGNSVQSWESTIMGRLQMDSADDSEPGGWAFVRRDGKIGLWIAENDAVNAGDEVSYFELDFSGATPTATKKTLPTTNPAGLSFRVDENPSADATTNNGEIDQLLIDKNGNLVIIESGFFDTVAESMTPPTGSGGLTAEQSRALTVGIESYNNAAGVVPTGFTASGGTTTFDSTQPWTASGSMTPTVSDDTQVLNTTRVAYDRSTGYVYVMEQDTDFIEDVYVFDPATGQMVYQELNGINPGLFNTGTQVVFTRGDVDGNAAVNAADIDTLFAAIADPTQGGTISAALGQEWYDLTGEGQLNADDGTELIQGVLNTRPGDANLDGRVNSDDFNLLALNFGTAGGWAKGNFNGTGPVNSDDFNLLALNFGFNNGGMAVSAVPEPSGLLSGLLGGAAAVMIGRRRR
jgi:hypothetical protein